MGVLRRRPDTATLWAVLCLVLAGLQGCKHSTEELKQGTETYTVKGLIVALDAPGGEITLQHEAIPGFMPAMTMPYKLVYGNSVSELHRGDVIRARLLVEKTTDGDYRNARLDELAVLAQARPNYKPQSNYHVPTAGDRVPNFRFVNQDGKHIAISGFAGRALLITFIYTRCPLGDFCPKMSRNFASVDAALRRDPAVYARTGLLSLSFDPAFDTPGVLRAYGSTYLHGEPFGHWQFAAPSPATLQQVEQYFNLGATGTGDAITHSLSTVLVGPDGKIVAWYPGNDWSANDVVEAMRRLALAGESPKADLSGRATARRQQG